MLVSYFIDERMVFLAQKFNIFLPAWDIGKLAKGIFLKVNLHHNLLATIGQQKEGNMKHSIVAAGLVTDFLCDGNLILLHSTIIQGLSSR